MKLSKIKLILLSVASLALLWSQSALAIGQLSKPILVTNVLRGQEIQETMTLFNSEKELKEFGLKASGDIADWTSFYLPEDLTSAITTIAIPAEDNVNAVAQIIVPNDTPNGRYVGNLIVTYAPAGAGGADDKSASVQQQVDRSVTITVTDKEIISLEAAVIPVSYGIQINEPLVIKMNYYNTGNISLKPQVQVRILEKTKVLADMIFPYPAADEAIAPLARKTLNIEWPSSSLKNGRYLAEVTVLVNGEEMFKDDFKFQVGTVGLILGASIFGGSGGWLGTLLITIIGLLILAVLVFIAIKLQKNSKKVKSATSSGRNLRAKPKSKQVNSIGFTTGRATAEKPATVNRHQGKGRSSSW